MTCFVDGPHWTRECRDVAYRHLVETPGDPPPRRPALPGAEELHAWKDPIDINKKTGIPLTLINLAYELRERNRKGGEREEEQGR
jgi:hypothetical protein